MSSDQALEVIPLGGLGEFGMHMMAFRSNGNIIVVDAAARRGIRIDWRIHARAGVGVTVATLAMAAGWLYWCAHSV